MKSSLTIVFTTLLVSVVILAATSAFGDKCIKCYAKGGNGGDAVIFGSKNSINRNTTDMVNTTETG
jgi:hypothetical protein